jgi:hypothetical protein
LMLDQVVLSQIWEANEMLRISPKFRASTANWTVKDFLDFVFWESCSNYALILSWVLPSYPLPIVRLDEKWHYHREPDQLHGEGDAR